MTACDFAEAFDRRGSLLTAQGRIVNLRLRRILRRMGLSPRHGAVLLHLAQTGSSPQQALIIGLAIDPSAMVGILRDFERDGTVTRHRDPDDRRRHIVEITERGSRRARAVNAAFERVEGHALRDCETAPPRSPLA